MDKIADDRGAEAIEDKDPGVSDADVFDTSFSEAIEEDNPVDESKAVELVVSAAADSKVEPAVVVEKGEDKSKIVVIDAEETFERRYKTLQGILDAESSKWKIKEEEFTKRLDALQEQLKGSTVKEEKKAIAEFVEELTPEEKKMLEEYEADFGTVSKMEELKRKKELTKTRSEIQKEIEERVQAIKEELLGKLDAQEAVIKPLVNSLNDVEEVTHFSTITDKHPDFETFVEDGSLEKWITEKPKYLQSALAKVYNSGTAEEVIELLNDFKKENNLTVASLEKGSISEIEAARAVKEKKKQVLRSVVTRKGPVNISHAPAEDFDSAFDEAIAAEK